MKNVLVTGGAGFIGSALVRGLLAEPDVERVVVFDDLSTGKEANLAEVADRICVMLKGEIVEQGDVYEVFENPQHDYTKALLAAVPRLGSMKGKSKPEKFPILKMAGTFEEAGAAEAGA